MCLRLYGCGKQGCWGFCVRETDVTQTGSLIIGSALLQDWRWTTKHSADLYGTPYKLLFTNFLDENAELTSSNECLWNSDVESGEMLEESNLLHLNLNIHQLNRSNFSSALFWPFPSWFSTCGVNCGPVRSNITCGRAVSDHFQPLSHIAWRAGLRFASSVITLIKPIL